MKIASSFASFAFLGSVLAASAVTPAAHADSPPTEVQQLLNAKGPIRSNFTPAGKSYSYGHASILIGTPVARVKKVVTNYPGFKELVPSKFSDCRVVAVDEQNSTTDVLMHIPLKSPLLKGIDVWQVIRFGPTREPAKDTFVEEGTFVKGENIKDSNIVFTWKKVTPAVTQLSVDLLTLPTIPATQDMIDEEQRDAAADVALGVRRKAQGNELPVTEL